MQIDELNSAIEIAPNTYWIGYNQNEIWTRTSAYLIVEGDEAAVIDPGSVLDFEIVKNKIEEIIPLEKIKYIILHHQDPDLCSSTPEFEKLTDLLVINTARASLFNRHYGITSFAESITHDGQEISFETGRKLRFYLTPYCHSPMAMVTYDEKNKILFSSDIFGAVNVKWALCAEEYGLEKYLNEMKQFMEPLMASNEAINNFINKVEPLEINMICPQHGSIIKNNIQWWFDQLKQMQFGKAISEGTTGMELVFDFI